MLCSLTRNINSKYKYLTKETKNNEILNNVRLMVRNDYKDFILTGLSLYRTLKYVFHI